MYYKLHLYGTTISCTYYSRFTKKSILFRLFSLLFLIPFVFGISITTIQAESKPLLHDKTTKDGKYKNNPRPNEAPTSLRKIAPGFLSGPDSYFSEPCDDFIPTITGSRFHCLDDLSPAQLTASAGIAYLWNTGETTQSIAVSPVAASTYTVTVTSFENCVKSASQFVDVFACAGNQCFFGGNDVSADVNWKIIQGSTADEDKVRIRTTYSRNFADNTYGENQIGWPGHHHTFNHLIGSDHLKLSLYDRSNIKKLEFKVDYISISGSAPSGYDCLGVTGHEGMMILGDASQILSATTSIDVNLNQYGYALTTDSPKTDDMYTPNPLYPDWIWDVWYEVDVKLTAFGPTGFGKANFLLIHASPSKTGMETELVTEGNCCQLTLSIDGGSAMCRGGETTLTANACEETSQILYASADTYLDQKNENINYGKCHTLVTSKSNGAESRSLLKFDRPIIPADAKNIKAILTLHKTGGTNNTPTQLTIHNVLTEWSEGTETCSGNQNSANWLTCQPGLPWSNQGGDFLSTPYSAAWVSGEGIYDFDITPLVVQWANNTVPNNGILIKSNNQETDNDNVIASREHAITGLRPVIILSYSMPSISSDMTYHWNNHATSSSISVSPSHSTAYQVTITDRSGCSGTATRSIVIYDLPDSEAGQGKSLCQGDSVVISAEASGGLAPYNYLWSPLLRSESAIIVSPEETTLYTVNITDARGCSSTDSVLVTIEKSLHGSAVNDGPLTCTKTVTALTAFPEEGVSYLWSTGATTRTIDVTSTGTFVLTVTDNSTGCTSSTQTSVITSDSRPAVVLLTDGPLTCEKTTITIAAAPSGGVPPYTYLWNNNLTSDVLSTASPLQATTFSVTVTDALGCTAEEAIIVTPLHKPSSAIIDNGPFTCTLTKVDLIATSDTGDRFQWSTGETSQSITISSAGTYTVTVTDAASGCTVMTSKAIIENPDVLKVSLTADGGLTCTESAIRLKASVQGGTPEYKCIWSHNLGDGLEKVIIPAAPAVYSITVVDATGCHGIASLPLEPPGKAKIGDFVWHDLNSNGIQDYNEPGIMGVMVTLYDSETNQIQSQTTTNFAGFYEFEGCSGTYYIVFGSWKNYSRTGQNKFHDDRDSDAHSLTGRTDDFTLADGEFNKTIDAGYTTCTSVDMFVWYDLNKNDIWNTNENGINGLKVRLWKINGSSRILWQEKLTGAKPGSPSDDGFCQFCPPAGKYYIEVVMPPIGLVRVKPNVGNNEAIDSDLTNQNGTATTDSFTLVSGFPMHDLAAGFYPMAQAGNTVWVDANANGIQDKEEVRVAGVKIEAYDAVSHKKIAQAMTDNNGVYSINYMEKRQVYFRFYPPLGYIVTHSRKDLDDINSDVDHTHGQNTTRTFTMQPGLNNGNIDLGLIYSSLPKVWTKVYAREDKIQNEIGWLIHNERNISHFIVEEKEGDLTFSVISSAIPSRQISTFSTQNKEFYQYYDGQSIETGTYIYRIRQINVDGSSALSQQVSVKRTGQTTFSCYPNPAYDETRIQLHLTREGMVDIGLYSAHGQWEKSVINHQFQTSGDASYKVKLEELPAGQYFLKCTVNEEIHTQPIIHLE